MSIDNKIVKIVSKDIQIHTLLEKTGYFSYLSLDTKIEDIGHFSLVDILIISDEIVTVNELDNYKTTFSMIDKVFYISSDPEKFGSIQNLLLSKNIIPIPPLLTNNQIVNKILEYTIDEFSVYNNICTFFGADHNVGTTMIAQSVAENFSKKLDKKVGLLFLNGKPSIDYIKHQSSLQGVGLDQIKMKFINGILSEDELYASCIKNNNLYVLPGASSVTGVRYYHPDHIENLLKLCSNAFDVVIIDAGSNPHFDIQMGIASLNSAHKRFLITTQSDKARRNFERIFNQILEPLGFKIDDFSLILNKYIYSDELYTDIQLTDMYQDIVKITNVPYLDIGFKTEKDEMSLLNYNNGEYINAINQICKVIALDLGLHFVENEKKTKGILSWLKRSS